MFSMVYCNAILEVTSLKRTPTPNYAKLLVTWRCCCSSIMLKSITKITTSNCRFFVMSCSRLFSFQAVSSTQTAWHPAIKSAHFLCSGNVFQLFASPARLTLQGLAARLPHILCSNVYQVLGFFPAGIQVTNSNSNLESRDTEKLLRLRRLKNQLQIYTLLDTDIHVVWMPIDNKLMMLKI